MSEAKPDIEALEREAAAAQAAVDAANAKLHAAKEKSAGLEISSAITTLTSYSQYVSAEHKKEIADLLGLGVGAKRAKGASTKGSGVKLPPKFQIPNGDKWVGRGALSKSFKEWAESAEGKKWRKDNPGQDWPAYPYNAK